MKGKIKKILKTKLIGFALGGLICGTLSVYAATYFPSINTTYDNSDSGMTSTNVQEAIDELYKVCSIQQIAADHIVENGNLQKDPYECRYFFTGQNPNNYITFNDEIAGWRILSIECDGSIKIIKTDNIKSMNWDSSVYRGNNDWSRPSDLNSYLNESYLYSGLNSTARSQIVLHSWSIGAITDENNNLEDQINDENCKIWNDKIALLTASEYLRTNSNSNCKTIRTYNNNYNTCKNSTWVYVSDYDWPWTLSASDDDLFSVFIARDSGRIVITNASSIMAVRPVVYLSSSVKLVGNGTQSNPYTIQ